MDQQNPMPQAPSEPKFSMGQAKTPHNMIDIFVNLLSFILFGITVASILVIFFQIINRYFPDTLATTYYTSGAYNVSSLHYSIAALIVAFPIYIWSLWFWFKSFKTAPEKIETRLSKWLTYIVLFLAAGTIIGDLISVIYNFLQGGLTVRFILETLTETVIAGLVFSFYFLERKKVQYKKEVSKAILTTILVSAVILVLAAIVLGFLAGGTPGQERIRRLNLQRANNLRQISQGISNFAYDNNRLPNDLTELKNNTRYNYYASTTADPETKKEYEYRQVSSNEYELCAEFNLSTLNETQSSDYYYPNDQWTKHDQGRVCQNQKVTFGTLPTIPAKPAPLR